MSTKQTTVKDVPASQVEYIVSVMENEGAQQINKSAQPNGLWTITGKFSKESEKLAELDLAVASFKPKSEAKEYIKEHQDIDILARTIWGEARGGSHLGMEAVAAVVLNRLKKEQPERFGRTISEVCLKPKQFSCWNAGDPNLEKLKKVTHEDEKFRICIEIAERAVRGELLDPTNGSDHYHTSAVSPPWSAGKIASKKIDNHLFFNNIA